ncbi:phosphoribosylanthranilate isomerase [Rhodococcus sp. BP-252]|uniref:N-(5'-phosphoribosyl)anthranilate isomerase n=1 Tax=Rhodococcoides kyotonense TaxID=398843 RepID=A0A177Y6R3_9NOCA|nr:MULTISPECIES: phosphoribosylanthranilate isomerase [Rhodococcus]NIL74114.1 N-(5'-phosphoribosyl)anthranilate isomerase [Rhodococcus sp. B10]MBY6410336.1 phosphoribosylanthranilate isomerase [Rhodococcus sp. BP-320]MBY6416218.1 phosphoribosylanthranilate isomerase [Rhodococcus sp. BP-321]MBY6420213.1 phosphoribosylanthranilate isomerase [Rhodococcus sp. BP-324]MBY6424892.1 phosphoribosylanthranilate isomerase [Rhodococcus sp. BP-323]
MTFIKLCGFRDRSTLDVALSLDVDAIGFVFVRSPRQISVEDARPLVELTRGRAEPVGVFKGATVSDILATASDAGLHTVQVHDLAGSDDVSRLHDAGLTVYRAVTAGADYTSIGEDDLLIDGSTAGAGEAWDWDRLERPDRPWILAGGLGVENVREGIAATGAAGVDVSSGIESSRGVKDARLIERFVAEVRR